MIQLTTNRIQFATIVQSMLRKFALVVSISLMGVSSFASAQQPLLEEMEALPAPNQVDEGFDLLMRAPLHEAFAETLLESPTPRPLIFRQPPEPIEELPPEFKPDGENVMWISGYWYWDDERNDFLWVSGVWRDAPFGQKWIMGYWHEQPNVNNGQVGYRWVSGFWMNADSEEVVYLPEPPQSLEVGPSMPAPSDDYYYVPGNWVHDQARYVWQPGQYSVHVENLVWVPPTYVWTPCGYVFRPGYMDRPFDQRGVVFAPIYFRQPVYLQPNFFYRPAFVINTGLGLLPHLFARRHRPHYYFGDWYANRYVQNDFWGWSTFGNFGFRHRHYDPLFNYYGSPFARQQNLSLRHWANQQHFHYARNVNLRPPMVFNTNIINQRTNIQNIQNIQNISINNFGSTGLPRQSAFLGDSLAHQARVSSTNLPGRQQHSRFTRLDEQQQRTELTRNGGDLQRHRRDLETYVAKTRTPDSQPNRIRMVTPTASADPNRTARLQQESARRMEAQAKIQQRQAEAISRAQVRRVESAQRQGQRNLEAQARNENRSFQRENLARNNPSRSGEQPAVSEQPRRDGSNSNTGQPFPRGRQGDLTERPQADRLAQQDRQPNPSQTQPKGLTPGSAANPSQAFPNREFSQNTRSRTQAADNMRLRATQPSQPVQPTRPVQPSQPMQPSQTAPTARPSQPDSRSLQRQNDAAQRQASEALRRQATEASRQAQEASRAQQRTASAQQRQTDSQRRQIETQQRQTQDNLRRQMEAQQRTQQRQTESLNRQQPSPAQRPTIQRSRTPSPTASQAQPRPQIQSQPRPQIQSQPRPQAQSQPRAQSRPQIQSQPRPQIQSQPRAQSRPQIQSQPRAQSRPQIQSQPRPQTQSQPRSSQRPDRSAQRGSKNRP